MTVSLSILSYVLKWYLEAILLPLNERLARSRKIRDIKVESNVIQGIRDNNGEMYCLRLFINLVLEILVKQLRFWLDNWIFDRALIEFLDQVKGLS